MKKSLLNGKVNYYQSRCMIESNQRQIWEIYQENFCVPTELFCMAVRFYEIHLTISFGKNFFPGFNFVIFFAKVYYMPF